MNLCNGNVFKSFTDVQVSPGRGAGLAMQRTYNSQDERPGPFGIGWTHCYDIRMEEENPTSNETDDALNVADRTDFFGGKHKYHRDADGLYSPPPYLFDETQSSYDTFLVSWQANQPSTLAEFTPSRRGVKPQGFSHVLPTPDARHPL